MDRFGFFSNVWIIPFTVRQTWRRLWETTVVHPRKLLDHSHRFRYSLFSKRDLFVYHASFARIGTYKGLQKHNGVSDILAGLRYHCSNCYGDHWILNPSRQSEKLQLRFLLRRRTYRPGDGQLVCNLALFIVNKRRGLIVL